MDSDDWMIIIWMDRHPWIDGWMDGFLSGETERHQYVDS